MAKEPTYRCSQCGHCVYAWACGPTHASLRASHEAYCKRVYEQLTGEPPTDLPRTEVEVGRRVGRWQERGSPGGHAPDLEACTMSHCQNCADLQREVERLTAENTVRAEEEERLRDTVQQAADREGVCWICRGLRPGWDVSPAAPDTRCECLAAQAERDRLRAAVDALLATANSAHDSVDLYADIDALRRARGDE